MIFYYFSEMQIHSMPSPQQLEEAPSLEPESEYEEESVEELSDIREENEEEEEEAGNTSLSSIAVNGDSRASEISAEGMVNENDEVEEEGYEEEVDGVMLVSDVSSEEEDVDVTRYALADSVNVEHIQLEEDDSEYTIEEEEEEEEEDSEITSDLSEEQDESELEVVSDIASGEDEDEDPHCTNRDSKVLIDLTQETESEDCIDEKDVDVAENDDVKRKRDQNESLLDSKDELDNQSVGSAHSPQHSVRLNKDVASPVVRKATSRNTIDCDDNETVHYTPVNKHLESVRTEMSRNTGPLSFKVNFKICMMSVFNRTYRWGGGWEKEHRKIPPSIPTLPRPLGMKSLVSIVPPVLNDALHGMKTSLSVHFYY